MAKFMAAVDSWNKRNGDTFLFLCPGCRIHHKIVTSGPEAKWTFNGNLDLPTCSPSLLVRWPEGQVCHSFIKDGMIQFLGDCTHPLAGQTVEIPEVE